MTEYSEMKTENEAKIRRGMRLSTVIATAASGLNAFYLYMSWQAKAWQMYILTGVIFAFAISTLFARRRFRLGQLASGTWIIILGMCVAVPTTAFLISDVGLIFAVSLLVLVFVISTQTLPAEAARRAIFLGTLIAALTATTNFLPLEYRLEVPIIRTLVPIVTSSVVAIVAFFLARRMWRRSSIRRKIIFAFSVITVIPIGLFSAHGVTISQTNMIEQAKTSLFETAQSAAVTFDVVLQTQVETISTEAKSSDFIEFLELSSTLRPDSLEEKSATSTLLNLVNKNPNISSYALLDTNGKNLIDTIPEDIGLDESDRDYFQAPISTGEAFISPFRFSQTTSLPNINFSAPIRNASGQTIGVLRARYDASYLQELLNEATSTDNKEQYAVLVDGDTYVRVAQTEKMSLNFKSYQFYTLGDIQILQKEGRLRPGNVVTALTIQEEIVDGINSLSTSPVFIAESQTYGDVPAYTSGQRLQSVDWIVLVRRTEQAILEPLQTHVITILATTLLLLAVAIGMGFIAARVLTNPIIRLTETAQNIADGELATRAQITSQDEVATLAASFNAMTDQLQGMLSGLEDRIAERTSELEAAQQQSEARFQTLESIAEISNVISTEQNLERLLPMITNMVSARLGYYHAGIFLLDQSERFAVLQASNSEGGQRMLEREHKLEVGLTGIVGNVAQTGKSRIALDVGDDVVFFDNPDLPETRSEIALPLLSRNKVIGVLDVQSVEASAFGEDDVRTLRVLADQISSSIENARLFEQTQQTLDELRDFSQQYVSREWKELTSREGIIGYHQKLTGGVYLEKPITSKEINQAMKIGDVIIDGTKKVKSNGSQQETLAVPIKLRDKTLGVINLKSPSINRSWTENEINMIKAVSDRLALAIEGSRLLEESQKAAAKEQVIGEVTGKIGSSINLRNVLQTAVEELGRVIPGSEIAIQFEGDDEKGGSD